MTTSPKDENLKGSNGRAVEEQLTALDADDDPESNVGEELTSLDGVFDPDDEDESGEVDEAEPAVSPAEPRSSGAEGDPVDVQGSPASGEAGVAE